MYTHQKQIVKFLYLSAIVYNSTEYDSSSVHRRFSSGGFSSFSQAHYIEQQPTHPEVQVPRQMYRRMGKRVGEPVHPSGYPAPGVLFLSAVMNYCTSIVFVRETLLYSATIDRQSLMYNVGQSIDSTYTPNRSITSHIHKPSVLMTFRRYNSHQDRLVFSRCRMQTYKFILSSGGKHRKRIGQWMEEWVEQNRPPLQTRCILSTDTIDQAGHR